MQSHPCVSFLLIRDGQILLEKRAVDKPMDAGLVAIPGGHMEPGESQLQALHRELKEELGVVALSQQFLCSLYHPTDELQLLHYYLVQDWQGEIQVYEAESVSWYKLEQAQPDIGADKVALTELMRLAQQKVVKL